jgi:hypothetical protein
MSGSTKRYTKMQIKIVGNVPTCAIQNKFFVHYCDLTTAGGPTCSAMHIHHVDSAKDEQNFNLPFADIE